MKKTRRRKHPIGSLTILFSAVFLLFSCAASMPGTTWSGPPLSAPGQVQGEKPRLVVFIVVDQLRGDLLTRYSHVFSGGLKRILNQGLSFTNALHGHAATETSPGHAALSTGVHPTRAGIPANVWREGTGTDRYAVNNVVDPNHALVGVSGLPGASPSVLRRGGLADWVLAQDSEARIIAVSAKDRGAVLMGGKTTGEVYWFNSQVGRFVTSTFYKDKNPGWLDDFNTGTLETYRADSVWSSTIPGGSEGLSSPDTASFEGDGVNTFFPHRYSQERIDPGMDDFFLWFEGTPMLDNATLDLAQRVVRETGAGFEEGRTDFLSISLSQTDRVGHAYGPLSREQMDNLLRLDRALGNFLTFLDDRVGEGNYVLGLSADHGVMTSPEREGGEGRRLSMEDRSRVEQALNRAVQEANQDSDSSVPSRMVAQLEELPFVGPAFLHEELASAQPLDSLGGLFRQSFVPGRAGGLLSIYGVEMWWSENTLDWGFSHGTTHGSPFHYDRWVPLIVLGPQIEAGVVDIPVRPLDLAPTLALLAGISFPDDLDGEPLPLGGG